MLSEKNPAGFESVNFSATQHTRMVVRPMYYELGFSPVPDVYGRRMVFDKLLLALSMLPSNYGFVVWDVYRPRAVQEKLFEWMRNEIRKNQPTLSDDENYAETKKYMSVPSKVGQTYCPPHLSGGAIDLTLFECSSGQEIDMGTKFDDPTERAHRDFFENLSVLKEEERQISNHRALLRNAMELAGFTSYRYEWWHYDFGNSFWENATGKKALFGPLFGDLEWPQKMQNEV